MPSESIGAAGPEPRDSTPLKRGRTTQEMLADRRGPGLAGSLLRALIVVAAVVALLAVVYFAASALEGDDPTAPAPWAQRGAPDVRPASLDDQ